jgi:hypothetical protein
MGSTVLERITFQSSRAIEYFNLSQLQTMTGQNAARFADVVMKELCDNAIDAAEEAGRAPELRIKVRRHGRYLYLVVRDNGGGIPPETVQSVLDFHTLTSNKANYRSPTRGMQGNALKTILGIPYALGSRQPVIIEARGVRHVIRCDIDPAGQLQIDAGPRPVPERPGTGVAVALPLRWCGSFDPGHWARAFALFNPHATVRIRKTDARSKHANNPPPVSRNRYRPSVEFPGKGWRKFLPTDLTSPWWYTDDDLARLVFGHVGCAKQGGKDMTLREFVRQFKGAARTREAQRVTAQFRQIARLSDFAEHREALPALLRAMQQFPASPREKLTLNSW